MGGQTALNVSVKLAESGALDKYDVEMIREMARRARSSPNNAA